ncbi:MAG: acyltransferase family protein [Acidimicrobiales bacterium]
MTEPSPRPRLPHVAALDGLRGAAVAAVLLYHARHLTGGWLGVDLFFVLSGYLITALLLQGWRRDGAVGLRDFWSRRVRRIGPALVVSLVGVGIYAATVARPSEMLSIRRDGLATLFEVANWRAILVDGDYWAAQLRPSPLLHTWSLSIEEQLYLVWPLVLVGVLAWRRRPRAVLVAAAGLAVASMVELVVLHHLGASRARLYYGTDTRASAMLLGAALAAGRLTLGPERWAATRRARQVAGLLAAAGLAVAWVALDGSTALPYQGALPLATVGAALVVASVADRNHPGLLGRALGVAPLVWLGTISYGVYLYHVPIYLVLGEARTGLRGWPLFAIQVAVTLALAAASYRFLELPIRERRMLHGRQARAAVPAGAAIAIIALVAGTLGARQAPGQLAEVAGTVDRSSVPGAPTVMLAGDSVPLLLGVELSKQRDDLGVSVLNRAVPGCHLLASLGPVRGVEGDVRHDVADCSEGGQYRRDVEDHKPDVIALMFGEFPNESVELDGRWSMPCQEVYLRALRDRLDAVVGDLRASGAPVVLVTAPGTSVSWILERVAPGMDERVRCTNQVLEDLARDTPGVSVVDLASYVCPTGQDCKTHIGDADLRPDGLHFQGDGAAAINRWLVPRVLAAARDGRGGSGSDGGGS